VSQDQHNDAEVRALRYLIEEVRTAAPPPVDWDGAEASLMSRIELERKAQPRKPPRTLRAMASFAVAAAAAAMLIAQLGRSPDASKTQASETTPVDLGAIPAERPADELPTYMVAAMKPNSVVEAADEPVRFALPGVATWVIDPGSRVVVDSVAVPHVITLERGTVHAEVVPRNAGDELVETFAVVAGTARVAVHGTVFSVARVGDRITVEVTRGAVTVGPASHRGITTGRLLVSPARAAFWIHGGELAEVLPRTPAGDSVSDPKIAGRADGLDEATPNEPDEPIAPAVPRGKRAGVEVAPPSADTPDAPLLSTSEARGLLMGCLRGMAAGGDDRVVTISSHVTAVADDTGRIHAVRFSPPLRPDQQERCGATLFHRRTTNGKTITFHIDVAR
jgi:ferric-dicitrate binding protein FerR (iron transport regulator)